MRQQIARLGQGRLHLHDGPIDLIIAIDASPAMKRIAEEAAIARFATVLDELCGELDLLRLPTGQALCGPVANRMRKATLPYARKHHFVTPMAAVAGSVADEILSIMQAEAVMDRAFVNNGGDIAFHLADGQSFRAGLIDRPDRPSLFASAELSSAKPVRGLATSGWRGRSFSLGIADAVTVLARTAGQADAAATIIANAVDLPGHPAINRQPARDLQPDSDLGARLVTTGVGQLGRADVDIALQSGVDIAAHLQSDGLIVAAALHLSGRTRSLGENHFVNTDHLEHA